MTNVNLLVSASTSCASLQKAVRVSGLRHDHIVECVCLCTCLSDSSIDFHSWNVSSCLPWVNVSATTMLVGQDRSVFDEGENPVDEQQSG